MIDDMTVRNLAPNTMLCYLKQVHYLARYFHKSPEQLTPEDIRGYQLYLAQDRKVSVNSRLVAMTALRFLRLPHLQDRRGRSRCEGLFASRLLAEHGLNSDHLADLPPGSLPHQI